MRADMRVGVCMRTDMCVGVYRHACGRAQMPLGDMRTHARIYISTDKWMDMRLCKCTDMCADECADMSTDV